MGTIWCAPAATIGRGTIVVRVADGATERLARRFTSLTGASLTITRRCLPVLVQGADQLDGRALPEEAELEAIADAIEGYGAIRWPDGKGPEVLDPFFARCRETVAWCTA